MTEYKRRKARRIYYRKLALRTDLKARQSARLDTIELDRARKHWAGIARQGVFRCLTDYCATVS